ncbi:cutinase-domain-containing protein [Triangularia verruculosa]|uniref:Cutinase n=1 Tax=Triangularia verruculosa TaxID=2587418 RepID=A0AAN6XPG5_9PEZI|nr:cutinase-domain-containing protein [Triangularia verruculosa]
MRFLATVTALTGTLVAALPSPLDEIRTRELVESHRQTMETLEARGWKSGSAATANELLDGGPCPRVIFIYARGSTEGGNLVGFFTGALGSPTGLALDAAFGGANVWVQGVGGAYTANLIDNLLPEGTTTAAINEMKNLLIRANSLCPQAKIVAGGYSQGAALAGAAISQSSAVIREQIKGVVLYGWTKNKQNNGQIPNYPANRLKVYCESGDLVCNGSLIVLPAHGSYADEAADEAPKFLISRINAS